VQVLNLKNDEFAGVWITIFKFKTMDCRLWI